jgi:polyhydroxybutyrate depolymerase
MRTLAATIALLGVTACGSDAGSAPASPGAGGSAGFADTGGAGTEAGSGGANAVTGGSPNGPGPRAPGAGGAATQVGSGGTSAATGGFPGGAGAPAVGAGGGTGGSGAAAPTTDCDPSKTLAPGDHEFSITSANGLTYRYTLVMPADVVAGKKAPLALIWHALWSSPEETRGLTHVDATMASYGTISVHPRSPDQSWDVGTCCTAIVLGRRRDETVFAKELLADVESKVCVDTHRVYTTGFSNGGMISQMLACKMADVFAAAAPIGSTLTIPPGECRPSRPVPIYMINGTADPLVGYAAPGLSGGLSVPDSFKTWADRDACTGAPETTLHQGKATCQTYAHCGAGAAVTLCSVEGMGHCLPGMKKESPMNCLTKNLILLGPPNDDIDGIDLSARFLSEHALP